MTEHPTAHSPSPFSLGIRGLCPRCGRGPLFDGFLTLAPACAVCGLDFGYADPADGPAFFAMSIWAVPVVIFAMWLELSWRAPYWVHLVTTLPLLLGGAILLLRPLKGWLVCSQYIYKAGEGVLDTVDETRIEPAHPAAGAIESQPEADRR